MPTENDSADSTSALAARSPGTRSASEPPSGERLTVHRLAGGKAASSFAEDVAAGLAACPKVLQPKYFYDELGSQLFDAICLLPEYYPTRAEAEILERASGEVIDALPGAPRKVRLLELGSGSSVKTRSLIEAILERQDTLHYLPLDISPTALERSAQELLGTYPALCITGFAADYHHALVGVGEWMGKAGTQSGERTLAIFLGSTIGNLEPAEAVRLLRDVRAALQPGAGLLLGADLKKDPEVLVAAYDDALGVTAAFNLNLLRRINEEMGGDFDLRRFRHRAIWNEEKGRIEMHLESLETQRVALRNLGLEVDFQAGETIHTENSHKFDRDQIETMARESGFGRSRTWVDSKNRFSANLLLAV